jgi:hypothetical protein
MATNNVINTPIPFGVTVGGTGLTSTTINQILYSSATSVISGLATVNSASLTTNLTGVPTWIGPLTNGQIIIGSTGGDPVAGTITAGSGISVTNSANSITIATTGSTGVVVWSTITASQIAAINSGYFTNSASLINVTLPATAAEGSLVSIGGQGAGGWTLTAGTGQTIIFGNQASSTAGSWSSTNQFDTIQVVCQVANTTWQVLGAVSQGLTKV